MPEVANYDVCAQVVTYRGGKLVVNVANRFLKSKITVEMSAEAKIDLDLGDLSNAKAGDKVSAVAGYVNPGLCELTLELEVALASPLAPPGSHARRPRPVAHGDAARRPGEKSKPGPDGTERVSPGPRKRSRPKGRPKSRRQRKAPPRTRQKRTIRPSRPHRRSPNQETT